MLDNLQNKTNKQPFVLAFDFGGTKMAIATATSQSDIIHRIEISTVECRDGKTALSKAIEAGQELVRKTRVAIGGELVSIGAATMGITRPDKVDMAPNVPGWAELHIEQSMSQAFPGIPIQIDNDVKVAALAEVNRGALKDINVGMYLNLGTGIAITYTFNGKVLHGYHGASGEIAYCLRSKNELCGVREEVAPLEELVGGKSIGILASQYFGVDMTAGDLFGRARTDSKYMAFVEEILQELAFHLTNVIIAWDPETVVFGGGLTRASDIIIPYITKYVEKFVPYPPKLKLAHFLRDAGLYGAVELALTDIKSKQESLVNLGAH